MGLDIVAYKKLKKNDELTKMSLKRKEVLWNGCEILLMHPSLKQFEKVFPDTQTPFNYDGTAYDYEGVEKYSIAAYGTYGWFRRVLDEYKDTVITEFPAAKAFDILINFSSCEGVIGTYACRLLSNAFTICYDSFKTWTIANMQSAECDFLIGIYDKFKAAFKYASDEGAVEFC